MRYELENSSLHFQLDPETLTWGIHSLKHGISIEAVQMQAAYRLGKAWFNGLGRGRRLDVELSHAVPSPHGPLEQLHLVQAPDANGLRCTLTFACPQEQPFLMWQVSIENGSSHPACLGRIEMLNAGGQARIRFQSSPTGEGRRAQGEANSLAFFSNGWGSWNYSGVYGSGDRFQRTRLSYLVSPVRVNRGTPHPLWRGHFGSDMFGVLGDTRRRLGILAGFLSQLEHFGSLEARTHTPAPVLRMWANGDGALLPPGSQISTDWACLSFLDLDAPDPLGPYVEAVARQYGIAQRFSSPAAVQTGWTSWYHFMQHITPADIQSNLEAAAALRPEISLDLIQIDDGFEPMIGDWLEMTPAFEQGVAPLAEAIRAKGFTPGLWLAPFIVDPRSHMARQHPQWLLRGQLNRPVNAGYGLRDVFMTALDLTHPDALAYAAETIHTAAHTWGFPYLKLDYLFAGALPGHYRDPTRTRAQVLRLGLQRLREAAGQDVTLLGCGCPLGTAIGLIDQMRIGPDVSDRWNPAYNGREFFFQHEPDFPSVRNSIHNTLARSALHQRWWHNDPDCLLLRPDTKLTLAEVHSLATTILLSGGSLLVSGHLPGLPADRLRILQTLFPPIGLRPRPMDWFDSPMPERLRLDLEGPVGDWHLLANFNWADRPRDLRLRPVDFGLEANAEYVARDFWNGNSYRMSLSDKAPGAATTGLTFKSVPAHGVILLAVRQLDPGVPVYAGSSLHISQGLEVAAWKATGDSVQMELTRPGQDKGEVELYLPGAPHKALLNGAPITWRATSGQPDRAGLFTFPVELNHSACLEIHFGAANLGAADGR